MAPESLKNIVVGPELERIIDTSLGELLLLVLKTFEDNVIQVDGETGEELPASLLLKRSIRLSKWLTNQGIKVGDNISINSENRLEFCTVPVGTLFSGATFAPLNPDYTPLELKHVLSLSKPKFIFCSSKTIDKMVSILPEHPYIQKLILFGNEDCKYQNVTRYADIVRGVESEELDDDFHSVSLDPVETVATILCSSGTTGLPKGVMCTHDNMTAYVDISRSIMGDMVENDDPSDAMMGFIPFFHSFGFMLMFLNILRGKRMVVLGRFKPKIFLESIVKYKVARMIVPPPVLLFLLKSPMVQNYDLSSIKEMRSGAAPMGKDMEKELKERFNVRHVSQAYGMTETTLGVLVSPHGKGKIGSCGKIVPGMMAKVIDDNGNPLPAYGEGEVCFKGPLIMKGYVGDPKSTHSTIDKDGWLHTGDVAYYDSDGYFFIVDRIKELIKYKAFQVAPAELEALLLTNPAIQDAAVIGLPNEEAGELPMAFIVKKLGKNITEREVEKFIEDNVSPQKRLRGGVIFLNEIPRNPTGKILRRVLKERAVKYKSKL
ncbi:luciferin 4-monooxygenase [Diabrotica undecimpunctata]|uniref:luciferin 4-monooxygenase n=1 Tax=Diabrotica undecimpunctata TaxID=50387 RepID=UPI003B63ACE7